MHGEIEASYDVVVVGGGMSGVCAAIAAARHGAHAALVHNRPVLGGNASSEIRMHICGALGTGHNRANARETGILEEIMLENRHRNPQHSFSIFDTILWEKCRFQDGLDLYLNTHIHAVDGRRRITAVRGEQLTTEKTFRLTAPLFIDATGDGTVAALAGARVMQGREAASTFGEAHAPDEADGYTMGNTLLFDTVDMGRPVPFEKPPWAYTFTEEDLAGRNHKEVTSGYWWVEIGGAGQDTVADGEEIRDDLLRAVYGVWDHIKNSGDHGAANLALSWVGFLPGKRESRRIRGDYVLREDDLTSGRIFDDAVAYGGWPIDLHVPKGIRTRLDPTTFVDLPRVYTIPYRCLYAKDVDNLFVAGRAVSASHVAFASLRVMGTCAVMGQAAGTAAALAAARGLGPRELGNQVTELRQLLADDDCYIPGYRNRNPSDLARSAAVSASSHLAGCSPDLAINGFARADASSGNGWVSEPLGPEGQWIRLDLPEPRPVGRVSLVFDSDLSRELMLSLSHTARTRYSLGLPKTLVRDYGLSMYLGADRVYSQDFHDNYLRFRRHELPEAVRCDGVVVTARATHGDPHARIFEIRLNT